MVIKTKFSIGDIVHKLTHRSITKRKTCPVCNGVGKLDTTTIPVIKVSCPNCCSIGTLQDGWAYKEWFIEDSNNKGFKITDIRVEHSAKWDRPSIYYQCRDHCYGGMYLEADLFNSIDLATKECKKRNKAVLAQR